jgi:hypothetical membrane protein
MGALAVFLLTVIGGANFPNYSHASQFISELGASGAPNARVINLAGFLPAGLLLIAFTFQACRLLCPSAASSRSWRNCRLVPLFSRAHQIAFKKLSPARK